MKSYARCDALADYALSEAALAPVTQFLSVLSVVFGVRQAGNPEVWAVARGLARNQKNQSLSPRQSWRARSRALTAL